MTYFPYDTQSCQIDVSLQMYPSMRCNLTTGNQICVYSILDLAIFVKEENQKLLVDLLIIAGGRDTVLLEKFSKNGEWDLGDTKAVYKEYFLEGVSVPFSTVQFTIQLHRKVL